jgi:hypothetical protein
MAATEGQWEVFAGDPDQVGIIGLFGLADEFGSYDIGVGQFIEPVLKFLAEQAVDLPQVAPEISLVNHDNY